MTESLLRICRACRRYTFEPACPRCRSTTRTPHPARFSPQDRYARYRRALLETAGPGG